MSFCSYSYPSDNSSDPRPPYKTPNAADEERKAFLALEEVFPIFPSPSGCTRHSGKVKFNKILDGIARDMNTQRPKTEVLLDLKNPPCGLVLKREFSDVSKDVYVPPSTSLKSQARGAKALMKEKLAGDPDVDCSWLTQEYVPFLSFAEIRFVCVGGRPIRELVTGVHSDKANSGSIWTFEPNDSMRTLSDLQ